MKKIRFSCFFLFVWGCVSFANAQHVNSSFERKLIEKALDNIEMYKSCITIADEETESDFQDLFKDKTSPVYNDLFGITGKKDINISEYLNLQKTNLVSPIIKICNIRKDKIWEEDGIWKVQFSFDKSLSYQNQCGINFNTQAFYGKMFRETMVMVYDEGNEKCRIESITGVIDSKNALPDDYCFLDSTDVRDHWIIYRHRDGTDENVKYNSFGQMLLTYGHEKEQFIYPDNDVSLICNYREDCHLMTLSYKGHHWRIKPHYEIGLGKTVSLGNDSFYNSLDSKSNNWGIDIGYAFPSRGFLKLGVFAGLVLSNSTIDLSYKNDYSLSTNQDIDGDTYDRYYSDLNLSQTTKIKELSIPLYVDMDFQFNQWVSLYLDFGAAFVFNASQEVDKFKGSAANVYGIYPQYNEMLLDYHWGYNGFVNSLNLTKNALCNSERITVNGFCPNLLLGTGFRVNIPSTPLAIDLGLEYQKGLGDMISVSTNTNEGKYNGKLIYNEVTENGSTEYVHDLLENAKSISRNALKLNMGLIVKF